MSQELPKILVVGAGWLGAKMANFLPQAQLSDKIIKNINDVLALIDEYQPDIIINAVAMKGRPNVDWCESHRPETYFANVHVPALLAEACRRSGVKLVHLSSGCIYQGDNNGLGFSETDEPNFQGSYYSHTKLAAEKLLQAYDNVLICRLRIPFDKEPTQSDTLSKLLGYDKIIVAKNSITVVDDFLVVLQKLIEQNQTGIFNCVNPQPVDYQEVLALYENLSGQKLHKEFIAAEDLLVEAPRSNCILNTTKLQTLGLAFPDTLTSLELTIKEYVKLQKSELTTDAVKRQPMKLLVTGGAGFIGSNFIRYWLKNYPADEIVNLDKLTYAGSLSNLKQEINHSRHQFVQADICDTGGLLEQLVKGCDIIVHFAAESHVDRSIDSADVFLKTNVEGTYNLLSLAKKYEKRFHHISTDEVFGTLSLDSFGKFDEKTGYNPRNPYSASKASSDHFVRAFFETHQLPITISNCSNNYGPYQNIEKMIPKTITNLLQNKKIPVYGQGLNVRDWLYVDDHCRAIDLIIHQGKIGETYCIGGMTEDISNLDLVKMILDVMDLGDDMIEFVSDRPGHDLKYAIDWSKIKEDLGYQPQFDFKTYLTKTIDWYKANRWWWQ